MTMMIAWHTLSHDKRMLRWMQMAVLRGWKEALGGEHNAASLSDVSQMEEPIVT